MFTKNFSYGKMSAVFIRQFFPALLFLIFLDVAWAQTTPPPGSIPAQPGLWSGGTFAYVSPPLYSDAFTAAQAAVDRRTNGQACFIYSIGNIVIDHKYNKDWTSNGCTSGRCSQQAGQCFQVEDAFAISSPTCPSGYTQSGFSGDNVYCYPTSTDQPDRGNPGLNDGGDNPAFCGTDVDNKSCGASPMVGHPINAATGNKYLEETDFSLTQPNSVGFVRYYNSSGSVVSTSMGANWRHLYDRSISYTFDPVAATYVASIFRADGHVYLYTSTDMATWRSGTNPVDVLTGASDGAGHPSGWVLRTADGKSESYDASGRLIAIADRANRSQTLSYRTDGRLRSVTDIYGRTLQFSYFNSGLLQSLTDPAGKRISFDYDTASNLMSVRYQDSAVRRYSYNEQNLTGNTDLPHALTGILDENGTRADGQRYATYSYNTAGKAVSTQLGNGIDRFLLAYPASNASYNRVVITDPLGTNRTYDFSSYRGQYKLDGVNIPGSTSASGSSSTCPVCNRFMGVSHDANGFVDAAFDGNNHQTSFAPNAVGLVESRMENDPAQPSGIKTTTTTWDSAQRLPRHVDEPGKTRDYDYDDHHDLHAFTITDTGSGTKRTTTYTYNALGLIASIDGPRTDVSDVTLFDYDNSGNLILITDALNRKTRFENYTANGDAQKITDPNGVVTLQTYDDRRRLKTRSIDGATTSFDYFPTGQVRKTTGPTGVAATYGYDVAQRLTDITDNLGNHIRYTLDNAGNRIREATFDPNGALTRNLSRDVDPLTGRVSDLYGAHGQHTRFTYDGVGNVKTSAEITSTARFTTTNTYDPMNRLSQVTDAKGGDVLYGYDLFGTSKSVTDPSTLVTTYTYDAFGSLVSQASPDTGTTTYVTDSAGNIVSQTDARQITATSSYDALNRILSRTYARTAENVRYSYDGSNYTSPAPNALGRLTGVTDESGSTTYFYNARGTLSREVHVVQGNTSTVAYAYDSADTLTSITHPNGDGVTYVLDAIGQVSEVDATIAGTPHVLATGIRYTPFGGWTSLTLENGITSSRSFDTDYRIGAIVSGSVLNRTYGFDDRNNISSITDGLDASRSQTLGYDELGELISASGRYGTLGFAYNGSSGDRASATTGSATKSYSYYTGTHRLNTASPLSYGYDAAGNATRRTMSLAATTYTYNSANRLATLSGLKSTAYLYNATGQRVSKAVGSGQNRVTTVFGYDQSGQLIQETNAATSAAIAEYFYLDGEPLAVYATPKPTGLLGQTGPTQIYYFHNDHLSTPQVLTDRNRAIAWSADYQPFGTVTLTTETVVNNLRLPGQYFDAEAGTHYNGFRNYEPATGRYVQSDPIGLAGGINAYAYVGGNPLSFSDPNGTQVVIPPPPIIVPPPVTPFPIRPNPPSISLPSLPSLSDICRFNTALCAAMASISQLGREAANAASQSCDDDDNEKECEIRYNQEYTYCESVGSRYPAGKRQAIQICRNSAFARYTACLNKQPEPPLAGRDTPI